MVEVGGHWRWRSKGTKFQFYIINKSGDSMYSMIISRMWWHVSVVPATQEAEAGELLELGRWRL